jgi:alkanesulfonate monooxygenase SsuD/methylene tetrahydromethanopterin reductase-like flavin-dependent oxidoreductase (luciferase family)
MAGTGNKLDFGFGVFPYSYVSFAEMAELAKLGDALGYYALALPEHLLTPNWPQAPISTKFWYDTIKFWYDTMVIGSYLAATTTRIKLLTDVSVVLYHPPGQMAKALATLDVVSGGHVLYGVGRIRSVSSAAPAPRQDRGWLRSGQGSAPILERVGL